MRYKSQEIFHAKKLLKAIRVIEDLAPKIARRTILILVRSNDQKVTHWRKEIQTWLSKIKSSNKVKTPSGKLSPQTISYHLFGEPLGLVTDVMHELRLAIGDEDKIAPIKVDLTKYNLDNLYVSLSSIYNDYVKYIDGSMSLDDLQTRMSKYYLYDGD